MGLTEENIGSSLLGREESNMFSDTELGGPAVGRAARVPLKISRSYPEYWGDVPQITATGEATVVSFVGCLSLSLAG